VNVGAHCAQINNPINWVLTTDSGSGLRVKGLTFKGSGFMDKG